MANVNGSYGNGISPKERLAAARQHLLYAKQLSGSAVEAFRSAEQDGESASTLLKALSQDVFEAGIARRPTRALSGAGERAEETLEQVVGHHQEISADLTELRDIDPELEQALFYARSEIEKVGSNGDTWLIRNAIDSAQREESNASTSMFEMERSLYGVDKELGKASESAGSIDAPTTGSDWGQRGGFGRGRGRWGGLGGGPGGYGRRWGRPHGQGHGHGYGRDGRWSGRGGPRPDFARQWRERWETRVREVRQRGAALEETANRLDNPFEAVDASAQRGQRYQRNLGEYVDQALLYVDQLERRMATQPPVTPSRSVPTPPAPTSPAPTPPVVPQPSAPIPIFDLPHWPLPSSPTPAPSPTPSPAPLPAESPSKPEGFFKKPWRGSNG